MGLHEEKVSGYYELVTEETRSMILPLTGTNLAVVQLARVESFVYCLPSNNPRGLATQGLLWSKDLFALAFLPA